MISPYSYDEWCKEIMLKLIYLTKCIIDLIVYPALKRATSMDSQRRVWLKQSNAHSLLYIASKY